MILKLTFWLMVTILVSFWPACASEQLQQNDQTPQFSLDLSGIGEIILAKTEAEQNETTQLIIKRPGGMREVIDTFEGLLPFDLIKHDLDADGVAEIISLLRHSDGVDVVPYVYGINQVIKRIYPENIDDENLLICREVFVTTFAGKSVLCTRNLVSFHDFGPPELFKLDYFSLNKNKLESVNQGLSDGDHFNIIMNKGALAFHSGEYIEAIDYYNQAISSSTGELSTKAFIEAIFYLAESRKYVKDFKSALELYDKIVLEFGQNHFTDAAQREIELISENQENLGILSFYIDVLSHINCDQWETALKLLENSPLTNQENSLKDRFLFTRAEVLTALNRIEEAIEVYHQIKKQFPKSSLIDTVDKILEDMEIAPEETDGL